jgi:hypothetical protein
MTGRYTDYSEPLLKVKAMIRTLDDLLLAGKIDEAMEVTPEIITELRLMQGMLVMMSGK